jgi:hypothetical protein
MTAPYDPLDSPDEPDESPEGDALDRATRHLRTLRAPPLPADLFVLSSDRAEATPLVSLRAETVPGKSFWSRTRVGLAIAAGTLALALIGIVIGGYLSRLPGAPDEEGLVAQIDPRDDEPQDVPVTSDIAPHPRLESLATQTAALKNRVQALRLRAEATGARRQADQLLAEYSRP